MLHQSDKSPQLTVQHSPIQALMAAELAKAPAFLQRAGNSLIDLFKALLPHLSEDAIQTFLPQYVENHIRNRVNKELLGFGHCQFVHCVNADEILSFRREGRPIICAFAHIGASRGVQQGLASLGMRAFGILNTTHLNGAAPIPPLPGIELWEASSDSPVATVFLKQAADKLRAGGLVLLSIDGKLGQEPYFLPCLGREVPFSKGIYKLQQTTGAAVIMARAQWRSDNNLDCIFEPAVSAPDTFTPDFSAHWLEARILADPSQIRIERLQEFSKLPYARFPQPPSNGVADLTTQVGYAQSDSY